MIKASSSIGILSFFANFRIFAKCKFNEKFTYNKIEHKHSVKKYIIYAISSLLLMLPLLSRAQSKSKNAPKLELRTVVLDPGHGGKDAGAVSKDKKTYEKNLVLKIARKVGAKINAQYPDVKVIYTRDRDVYLTLNERADIANRNNADLFISFHINANAKTSPNGFSTHIFGRSDGRGDSDLMRLNMDVCRRENAVILLEDDYNTKYEGFDPSDPESFIFFNLMQNAYYEQSLLFAASCQEQLKAGTALKKDRGIAQDPFYVLWKTTMPSVLVETGFISNPEELAILRSEEGLEKIAESIFRAFCRFKKDYDGSIDVNGKAAPAVTENNEAKAEVLYCWQALASSKDYPLTDARFKGLKTVKIPDGKVIRYFVAVSDTLEDARRMSAEVKKHFPDAFLVKLSGQEITRIK